MSFTIFQKVIPRMFVTMFDGFVMLNMSKLYCLIGRIFSIMFPYMHLC